MHLYGSFDLSHAEMVLPKPLFPSINSFKLFSPSEIDFGVQCEVQT